LINPAASAIVVVVVIVVVATIVVNVIAVAVFGAVVSLVADLSAAEASSLADTPVMYIGGHGGRVAIVVIIVAAAEGLAQLIQSFVDIVELDGEMVELHRFGATRGRGAGSGSKEAVVSAVSAFVKVFVDTVEGVGVCLRGGKDLSKVLVIGGGGDLDHLMEVQG